MAVEEGEKLALKDALKVVVVHNIIQIPCATDDFGKCTVN